VAFSVFSKHASRVDLLLYDAVDARAPSRILTLDPRVNRTNHYWHAFVPGAGVGQVYAYRAWGPDDPARGHCFDPDKVLIDPYGRAVGVPAAYDRFAGARPGRNDPYAMKSVVADLSRYDWEDDAPLRRPFAQTVIYEAHVRGFTRHPSSGVPRERRGTYAGFVEKIRYLQDLGVTAVELLPIFQFDPQDAPPGRTNYWGYAPVSFFAPHLGYAASGDPLGALDELRDLVKALHRAGLEVILDVVYNHTAEGDARGPTQSLKGLGNADYYTLTDGGAGYANFSGTGNTLNAGHAVTRRLILDSLRHWVREFHVDGFRFDLASILARDASGQPVPNPPLLWDIDTDAELAGTKLIAEAWDAAGLYQVGSFAGDFWKEWNGKFRDDVRAFVKGQPGMVPRLADRLLGSPDLYGERPRQPEQSINFVTAHDGFTLNDLVSYDRKHNEANGEGNRDGEAHNLSWNHGVEGPSDDPAIEALRNRQVKNFLALTLLSLGAPMIVMGDEVRRSQRGNNNAYCQDNEISWMDWRLLERHADVHRFVRELIGLRFLRDHVRDGGHMTLSEMRDKAQVRLHGVRLGRPDLTEPSRSLALSATSLSGKLHMYFAVNAWWEPLTFELPPPPAHDTPWRRVLDTARDAPDDIHPLSEAPAIDDVEARVAPRSLLALMCALEVGGARPPHDDGPLTNETGPQRDGPSTRRALNETGPQRDGPSTRRALNETGPQRDEPATVRPRAREARSETDGSTSGDRRRRHRHRHRGGPARRRR